MKNFLFMIGLFLAISLFTSNEEINSDDLRMQEREAVMKEKNAADMQHRLEAISQDLRNSNCLTPRRNVQNSSQTINIRVVKNAERLLQFIRLRSESRLQKVSEYVSLNETSNYSALLTRMRYHVYALRKIII